MRLDQMRQIIAVIDVLVMCDEKPTRHAIAKNIKSFSRSTTYRYVKQMSKKGLVKIVKVRNEDPMIMVTEKGNSFAKAWREFNIKTS